MRRIIYASVGVLFFVLWSCGGNQHTVKSSAQAGEPITNDFKRAKHFVWDSLYQKVHHLSVHPHWFQNSKGFAYHVNTPHGIRYYTVLWPEFNKQKAFDYQRFAKKLHALTGDSIAANKLPLSQVEWQTKNEFTFHFNHKKYQVDLKTYQINFVKNTTAERDVSPNGQYAVFIKDHNLYVENLENGTVKPLSKDGTRSYIYGSAYGWGQIMKGENAEPKPRLKVVWSPDSQKILTQITDTREGKKLYMLNWFVDSLYRPTLLSYYRALPGDTAFVKLIPVVFDIQTGEMTRIALKPTPHVIDLGLNLHWTNDSQYLYGTYDRRGFKKKDIVAVDPETGEVDILYTDKSKTNIDYKARFHYVDYKGTKNDLAFITSEKTGWKQIYRIHWATGKIQPVTQGQYVVKSIEAIDTTKRVLYFTAAGKKEQLNPYYNFLYKVNFDGTDLQLLTPEPVNHKVYISPNKAYFVDNLSTASIPTISLLRSTKNGKTLMKVDSARIGKLKAMGWQPPQVFVATARDGETKIYGALWKPTNFDPQKKYPLVDFTYTGPHTNVFPNTFSKGLYGLYNSSQALAELGFVVMQVDGMGSAGRSKAFHDVSYKDLGHNLQGHVLAIKQLGERYSWIDTTRVGIYGHSFGGYDAAHALAVYNAVYEVAISESADHDWRMEKAWYPELYAGWPVDEVYENQSNITLASQMEGRLLLIHGGIDENVNPSATFKLVEELIKAGKYFDLLIVPSAHHHFPEAYVPYVQKKRWRFFVDNLIVNPPKE